MDKQKENGKVKGENDTIFIYEIEKSRNTIMTKLMKVEEIS